VNTLRALLYADTRSTINQLTSIRKSPWRAIVWTLFALLVCAGIITRIVRAAYHQPVPFEMLSPPAVADAIVCFIAIGLGCTLAIGSRMAGLFAHPAEARFIIGSPATPFIATLYVQTRDIFVSSARRGLALLYAALVYLPGGLSAGAFSRNLIIIVLAFTAVAAVPLARQLLNERYVIVAQVAGFTLAALGAVPLLRDVAMAVQPAPPLGPVLLALPPVHPGRLLLSGPLPQFLTIAVLFVLLAVVFVFVARRARDAYPELYELSMNRLQRVERLRNRHAGSARVAALAKLPDRASSASGAAPAGVMIFLWRAWTEYRRTTSVRSTAIETAVLLVGGYGLARLTDGRTERFISIATTVSTLLFVVALARAAALATELRRPLFWLSPATLFERLVAMAIAHGWRIMSWFALIAIGLAAGHAPLPLVLATVVAGPSAVLLAIGIGYASYALLPHEVDQRGPMMFVRIALGYVFGIPAIAVGIVAGNFLHATLIAIGLAALTALMETVVLIGFASWRLDRMSIPLR
jgi:hypothetical protein